MSNNSRRRKLRALTEAARPKPYDWEQAKLRYAGSPSLLDNFCHATIGNVIYGPRRELILTLQPLIWIGNEGHYDPGFDVRFGGIINYNEVVASFSEGYKRSHELAWLRYDDDHQSRPGDLCLGLAFERIEAHVIIHCYHLAVSELEQDEDA